MKVAVYFLKFVLKYQQYFTTKSTRLGADLLHSFFVTSTKRDFQVITVPSLILTLRISWSWMHSIKLSQNLSTVFLDVLIDFWLLLTLPFLPFSHPNEKILLQNISISMAQTPMGTYTKFFLWKFILKF